MEKDMIDVQREIIEVLKLQQNQIDSLQKQINIIMAKSVDEINKIIGERIAEPKTGLKHLHEEAGIKTKEDE